MCTRCSQRYGMAFEQISNQQAMEILEAKAAVENKKRTYEKVQLGPSTVKPKDEVICKATKGRTKSSLESFTQHKMKGCKVHFASLMDVCHHKHAELFKSRQQYKGRVVFIRRHCKRRRGAPSRAFAEQGSSASQVAAAKFLDTIFRLRRMSRRANDAVSACTQTCQTRLTF